MSGAIALAGGFSLAPGLVLWLVLAVRDAGSISYVRARLRKSRGVEAPIGPALVVQAAGIAVFALPVAFGAARWPLVALGLVLFARALVGLQTSKVVPPKAIGFQEIGYGLLTVVIAALSIL